MNQLPLLILTDVTSSVRCFFACLILGAWETDTARMSKPNAGERLQFSLDAFGSDTKLSAR